MKKLILITSLILFASHAHAGSRGGGSEFKLPIDGSADATLEIQSGDQGPARELYNELIAIEVNRSPTDGSYTDFVKTLGNVQCERFQMGAPGPHWSYTCKIKINLGNN